jgi:hypothetical protein
MAETIPVPDAWVGQEAHLRYVDADAPRSLNCALREVNDRGVCVDAGDEVSFFPWGSVVRIDLGHSRPARGLRPR